MRGSLRLNRCKPHNNLHSSQLIGTNSHTHFNSHMCSKTLIKKTTSRISTHHSYYTLKEGVADMLEDELVEEDLVGE